MQEVESSSLFANVLYLFYYLIMKKINLSIKELKRYKVKFSVQKNIKFSNTNKIANRLARAFKNFKTLKF